MHHCCNSQIEPVYPRTVPSNSMLSRPSHIEDYFAEALTKVMPLPDNIVCDYNGSIKIRIRVHVIGVYNVDTLTQTFEAKVWVQFKWTVIGDVGSFEDLWKPKMDIINNIDDLQVNEESWRKKTGVVPEHTVLYYSQLIQGKFAERFELYRFPLDTQLLQIRTILWSCPQQITRRTAEGEVHEIECSRPVTFVNGGSLIYNEAFIQKDEWTLTDKVFISQDKSIGEKVENGIQYATLDIVIAISRHYNFYVYNIIFPIFMMVILAFSSFLPGCMEFDSKMQINLTLILTLVAFKLVVTQYVPTTSYLTYLDKYIVMSFAFMTTITGHAPLCQAISDLESCDIIKNNIAKALFASWMIVNATCAVSVVIPRYKYKPLTFNGLCGS